MLIEYTHGLLTQGPVLIIALSWVTTYYSIATLIATCHGMQGFV